MFSTPKKGTTPASTNAPQHIQNTYTQKTLVFSSEGTALKVDPTIRRLKFEGIIKNDQSSANLDAISNGFARIRVK